MFPTDGIQNGLFCKRLLSPRITRKQDVWSSDMTYCSFLTKSFPPLAPNLNYSFLCDCGSFCRREGKNGLELLFNWLQAGYWRSAGLPLCSYSQAWGDHCSRLTFTGTHSLQETPAGPPCPLRRREVHAHLCSRGAACLHWHAGSAPISKACRVSLKWWGDKQHLCCIPSGTTFNWIILLSGHSGLALWATGIKCAGNTDLC